ncbi:sigma-54 dependent transcriptional regulator [Desulfuromonas sp. AOP6]|uniref:sigma-54 dependent transcriptional regulator n=1 Tax=Desulfuromonas sp. AOP6 TaxID=1566351 RepID=UPI00126B6776|nr:sigma-54 dependent transcriptional regulator [Desulfuromonas sp. AOP6]BCA80714.1 sigma-54-dependent Fis family transcriptional regulator [Desulfuromonas sp. AOP6]
MAQKILIIDDEESIRFTFSSFLVEEGYAVETAANYTEAMDRLAAGGVDLIFSDILLGGDSGIDILQEVRSQGIDVPVIMITGFPGVETAREAVRLGAFDYLSKPVTQDILLRTTQVALRYKSINDEKKRYQADLDAIFHSVSEGIVTVDSQMHIVRMNEAAAGLCGFDTAVSGQDFKSLSLDCQGRCRDALEETLGKKAPIDLPRFECQRPGKPAQVVSATTAPLVNGEGAMYGAVLVIRDETRLHTLECDLKERTSFHKLVGGSDRMQEVYALLEKLANVPSTVLITGESGTGKELIADALHYQGARRQGPLVKVNCAALTENLLESELFGHVKGSFTGAIRDKAGRFEMADGGTIFLDEIGDISPAMQVRLLRVLQDRKVERVGGTRPIAVDVRVVAATNQNLPEKIKRGEFREDLFYRLKVVTVPLPPLRERRTDIPMLVDFFIQRFNGRFQRDIRGISDEVMRFFMSYEWPGNVRELEHVMEHAFILCPGAHILAEHLPPDLNTHIPGARSRHLREDENEVDTIRQALEKCGWNKAKAARLLGISRRTIYRKMEELDIQE